jgi:glycerol-1-phosphate dehydrogenase [NAD(P)+]
MSNWPKLNKGKNALPSSANSWENYFVVTTPSPWSLANSTLMNAKEIIFVHDLDKANLDRLGREFNAAPMIIGIGSGTAMDAAKFLAKYTDAELVQVPTTSSNNACFTRTAWTFEGKKRVAERNTPIPKEIVIDYNLFEKAPIRMNRAGAAEILCSHTALFDWKLAHDAGVDVEWDEDLESETRSELQRLVGYASEIGAAKVEAFAEIMEVGRKFALGFTSHPKARFNAGSEHIVAWAIEQTADKRIIHGEAVSLATLLMAHIQQNKPDFALDIILSSKILYHPEDIGTSWSRIENIFTYLFDFAEGIPWHTIITEYSQKGESGRRELISRFKEARKFIEDVR